MLLQLVISLVSFVYLEHHRVELPIEGLISGVVILIDELFSGEVCCFLFEILAAW